MVTGEASRFWQFFANLSSAHTRHPVCGTPVAACVSITPVQPCRRVSRLQVRKANAVPFANRGTERATAALVENVSRVILRPRIPNRLSGHDEKGPLTGHWLRRGNTAADANSHGRPR